MARFTLHYNPCDVLLVSDDLLARDGCQGLAWLVWNRRLPTLLLVDGSPERFTKAYEMGIAHCLPQLLAHENPALLDMALEQALKLGERDREHHQASGQIAGLRRHIDRLVGLVWRQADRRANQHWYPQRHMLERLEEELARADRHKLPLTVAIGEVAQGAAAEAPATLPEWTPEAILRGKRRCDVAGQYGQQGFMLLMAQTPKSGGMQCCQRLKHLLEHPPQELAAPRDSLRALFGLASTVGDKNNPQTILRLAEENLEAARASHEDHIRAGV